MSGTAIILMTHRMYPQSGLGEEGSSTLVALVRLMIRIWSILMRLHMNFKLALFFKSHAALIALLSSHGCNIVQIADAVFLLVNISSMFVSELAITHPAMICTVAQRIVNDS